VQARRRPRNIREIMPVEHVHPLVRTQEQLDRVFTEIEEMPGIVLYTLLQENLAARLEEKCRTSLPV
jgi:[pyruvate, water dikinase]-phosphate phosphotransferase / [pyruvate, water dikinase] kinase